MRVAHFVQRYPPALGGSEAYFERLSKALAAEGEEVTVFTSAAVDLEAFWSPQTQCLAAGQTRENGVQVRRYGLWRWPGRRYFLKPLSLIPHRFWQCLTLPCNPICLAMWTDVTKQTNFDLVHATAFPYAWPIACGLRLARRLKIPFLLTPFLHLGDPENPHDQIRQAYMQPPLLYLLRAADRVFVQTDLERAALLEQGIDPAKLVRSGMGVELQECCFGNRELIRRKWGIAADEIVIGHLANKSEEKGTVDLLKAAQQLWDRGMGFQLVLAGPEMPNFLRFWRTFPGANRVRRLGILDAKEKPDFFAGLDMFCLPSRSDAFGLVLLEAWANGIPNVAYRAGGVAEVIHHEQDGLLVRCGNVDELAQALHRLIDGAGLRRRLGHSGQFRIEREFRWQDKLSLVRKVYREVSEDKSAGLKNDGHEKSPGSAGKPGL